MKYRREIDGLRAIAVLPVIFFHAGFKTFEGGFVGVDVFFVISGYLITSIILSDLDNQTFSIVTFYERRARRILPALFFMMFCCLPFAWLWLLPNHLKDFSQSLAAVTVFSSNMLFWQESGYFGVSSELKPLLHTWSLAVEEQYYVLFPLFLMALWKLRKRWIFGSLVLLGVFSLAAAQWGAYNEPSATFFLLPTRGWELAIGALIAFYFFYKNEQIEFIKTQKKLCEALGLIGLLLICYSIFSFDDDTPFPSLYALIPTIGTGLIILFSTHETIVGRFLGKKSIVGIGLISYSAYLWHQPLFVFARHRCLEEPSRGVLLALSLSSILLAYISWRFVENPFRNKNIISRKHIFSFALIGSVFFAAVGIAGHVNNGFDSRVNSNGLLLTSIVDKAKANPGLSPDCTDEEFSLSGNCRTSDNPEILLWGDSYAMHLAQGIVASNPDVRMIQMAKSQCGPFFDAAPGHIKNWAEGCVDFNNSVREWLQTNSSVKYVVLSSPFLAYLRGRILSGDQFISTDKATALGLFEKTLSEIKSMNKVPIVFSPLPRTGENIGECLVRAQAFGSELSGCDFSEKDIRHTTNSVYDFLSEISKKTKVVFLNEEICREGKCQSAIDSTFIYRDDGHFSHEGSALVGEKMDFYKLITSN